MRGRFASTCVLAVAALWLPPVQAGTFSISPLRVDLSASTATAALTVRNQEQEAVVVQAESMAWAQEAGEERLDETRDLLVSPPIFTLPPGGSQVVRVALRRGTDSQRELSYRLLLQEVPRQADPGFTGLQVVLRLSLPVFVEPKAPAKPELDWSVTRTPDGRLQVRADNTGSAHARVLNFRLAPADAGAPDLEQPVVAYVLPGQYRVWMLGESTAGAGESFMARASERFRLTGRTDQGEFSAELAVGP
jgi:fimbrial chaperone protein